MIAQDFSRVSVLGSGSIATPYGVATMCAHAGKRPARVRPAQFASGRIFEIWDYLLELNDICLFDKRLGEISGLICFDLSRWLTELSLHSPCKSLLLARWICGREARECGQARWATRVQRVVRGLSTRPEGRAPVRRTRPHLRRAVGRLASAGGVVSQDKAGLIATVDHADMRGLGTTGLHCVAELAFL